MIQVHLTPVYLILTLPALILEQSIFMVGVITFFNPENIKWTLPVFVFGLAYNLESA